LFSPAYNHTRVNMGASRQHREEIAQAPRTIAFVKPAQGTWNQNPHGKRALPYNAFLWSSETNLFHKGS
jgi:hypothetical protein